MDIVFDVDGTLFDISHRVHLIRPPEGVKKDWAAFRAAAESDRPIFPIFLVALAMREVGHRIAICTGRKEKEAPLLERMLHEHGMPIGVPIYMRGDHDDRPDHVVKLEMLERLNRDGFIPQLVFDDRQQVVDMWRAQGIRVCQVAKGDF